MIALDGAWVIPCKPVAANRSPGPDSSYAPWFQMTA